MILHQTGEPLDIVQTYSHANLQNNTLAQFISYLYEDAQIPIVMNASPLNMGLLTPSCGPDWHPAPKELREVSRQAGAQVEEAVVRDETLSGTNIAHVAVSFGMRNFCKYPPLPVVVGANTLEQVHNAVRAFFDVRQPQDQVKDRKMRELEIQVRDRFTTSGWVDWSWESPQPSALQ